MANKNDNKIIQNEPYCSNNANKQRQILSLVIKIICVILGVTMLATLFMPLLVHHHENDIKNGYGPYNAVDALEGGFYAGTQNDEFVQDETGMAYVKYEAMSEKAKSYYDQFVYLTQNREGRSAALFYLFALLAACFFAVFALLSIFVKENTFVWQAAAALLSVIFAVVSIFYVKSLTDYTYVSATPRMHFVVNVGSGLWILLAFGIISFALSTFGFFAKNKKVI